MYREDSIKKKIINSAISLSIISSPPLEITKINVGIYKLQTESISILVKIRKSSIANLEYLGLTRFLLELLGLSFYNEVNFYIANQNSGLIPKLYGYDNFCIFIEFIKGNRIADLEFNKVVREQIVNLYLDFLNLSTNTYVKKIRIYFFRRIRSLTLSLNILVIQNVFKIGFTNVKSILTLLHQHSINYKYLKDSLMHSDFHMGNIIASGDRLYVLDFDSIRMEKSFPFIDVVRYYFDYSSLSIEFIDLHSLMKKHLIDETLIYNIIRIALIRLILPYLNERRYLVFLIDTLISEEGYSKWIKIQNLM